MPLSDSCGPMISICTQRQIHRFHFLQLTFACIDFGVRTCDGDNLNALICASIGEHGTAQPADSLPPTHVLIACSDKQP